MSDGGPPTVPPTATAFPLCTATNSCCIKYVLECPLPPRLLFHPGGKLFQKGQRARANSTQCLNSHWHDGVGWGKAAAFFSSAIPATAPALLASGMQAIRQSQSVWAGGIPDQGFTILPWHHSHPIWTFAI